ncbi:hypothetical protein [Acidisphaera sp. L21]|nr:hypothetical protein [Acidisphaera sp. L21]
MPDPAKPILPETDAADTAGAEGAGPPDPTGGQAVPRKPEPPPKQP